MLSNGFYNVYWIDTHIEFWIGGKKVQLQAVFLNVKRIALIKPLRAKDNASGTCHRCQRSFEHNCAAIGTNEHLIRSQLKPCLT